MRSRLLVVAWCVGCTTELTLPPDSQISCTTNADCPGNQACVRALGRCLAPDVPCVEQVGGELRAEAEGSRCEAEGVETGRGVCHVGACVTGDCGDGIRDLLTEDCDDGANNSNDVTDACRLNCDLPSCGDGVEDSNEECDDGNGSDEDSCLTSCAANICGDTIVNTGVEDCDDGNAFSTDACLPGCVANVCGDGALHFGVESCEDQNDDPNDGCAVCQTTTWDVAHSFGFGPSRGDPLGFNLGSGGSDIASDVYGNLYIADSFNNVVWRVEGGSGFIRPYVGRSPTSTPLPAPANWVALDTPTGLALDAQGNLYVSERFGRRVLKIDFRTQMASVVAGGYGCFAGACGDGGPAIAAGMGEAMDVAVDRDGNLFIADAYLDRLRKVDVTTGLITEVFTLDSLASVAVADNGDIFVAQDKGTATVSHAVWRWRSSLVRIAGAGAACTDSTLPCGDGGTATAANLNYPSHIATNAAGTTVYIADSINRRLRGVTVGGNIVRLAGTGGSCSGAGCNPGGPATLASLASPDAVTIAADGTLRLLDGNSVYRLWDPLESTCRHASLSIL